MLMPEERRVLNCLQRAATATAAEVARACLPGADAETVARVVGQLDWLGYITLYPGASPATTVMQITAKGRACATRSRAATPG